MLFAEPHSHDLLINFSITSADKRVAPLGSFKYHVVHLLGLLAVQGEERCSVFGGSWSAPLPQAEESMQVRWP